MTVSDREAVALASGRAPCIPECGWLLTFAEFDVMIRHSHATAAGPDGSSYTACDRLASPRAVCSLPHVDYGWSVARGLHLGLPRPSAEKGRPCSAGG